MLYFLLVPNMKDLAFVFYARFTTSWQPHPAMQGKLAGERNLHWQVLFLSENGIAWFDIIPRTQVQRKTCRLVRHNYTGDRYI